MIALKPLNGTSVMTPARDVAKDGIYPALHVRTPWADSETGCDCGRNKAKPVFHAWWCEVRLDWSYGDD